jgi:homogentisate 1,2-dioxygenase
MFESRHMFAPTQQALQCASRQRGYQSCWQGLRKNFKPDNA